MSFGKGEAAAASMVTGLHLTISRRTAVQLLGVGITSMSASPAGARIQDDDALSESVRRDLECLHPQTDLDLKADLESSSNDVESYLIKKAQASVVDLIVGLPKSGSAGGVAADGSFVLHGKRYWVRLVPDADDPSVLIISITSQGSLLKPKTFEFAIESGGQYRSFRLAFDPTLRIKNELVARAIAAIFESGYRYLKEYVFRRLQKTCLDATNELYYLIRSALRPEVANRIFLYLLVDNNGIYLHEPLSRRAALEHSVKSRDILIKPPLIQLIRLDTLILPSTELFYPQCRVSRVDLRKAPYIKTGLDLAEKTVLTSDKMIIQILAEVGAIRLDACYPASLFEAVDPALYQLTPKIRVILSVYSSDLRALVEGRMGPCVAKESAPESMQPPNPREQIDVFISYSREDRAEASVLDDYLKRRGLRTWIDKELKGGDRWQSKIDVAISRAKAAVILLGIHGCGTWQNHECQIFLSQPSRFRIIPVRLPGYNELPQLLSPFQTVDFLGSIYDAQALEALYEAITGGREAPDGAVDLQPAS